MWRLVPLLPSPADEPDDLQLIPWLDGRGAPLLFAHDLAVALDGHAIRFHLEERQQSVQRQARRHLAQTAVDNNRYQFCFGRFHRGFDFRLSRLLYSIFTPATSTYHNRIPTCT